MTAQTDRLNSALDGRYNIVRHLREGGNRMQALKGTRHGQHSIRINDQYRLCFRWEEGYADDVEVTDYH